MTLATRSSLAERFSRRQFYDYDGCTDCRLTCKDVEGKTQQRWLLIDIEHEHDIRNANYINGRGGVDDKAAVHVQYIFFSQRSMAEITYV